MPRTLRPMAVFLLALLMPITSHAASTDAERIRALEAQLEQQRALMEQQQKMLEAMQSELERLKAGQPPTEEAQVAILEKEKLPVEVEADELRGYELNVYGHMQLDLIYDFERVDPTWESTLRPSTIPIEDGLYGDDGNTVVSVKQTQLGFRGQTPTPGARSGPGLSSTSSAPAPTPATPSSTCAMPGPRWAVSASARPIPTSWTSPSFPT